MSTSWRRRVGLVGLVVVLAPVITAGMILTHEIGHTVVARLLGDRRATFVLYRRGSCIGCNLYDSQKLSPWGNVAVSVAGVWFTALLSLLAVAAMAWRRRPRWLLPRWLLLETVIICYFGDLIWQIAQAVQVPTPVLEPVGWGLGYTDFSAAVSFCSQATGWSHRLAAGLGLAIAATYTVALAIVLRSAWLRDAAGPGRSRARRDE
jgi:Peptidase M50B-like